MPNYLAPFLATMQQQANVQDTQAQTQQRLMAVMQGQQQLDQQKKEAQLLQGLVTGQGPGGGDAKTAGQEYTQDQDGYVAPSNPNDPIAATVKNAKADVARAAQTVQIAAATGDYKNYAKAQEQLATQQKELRLAYKETADENQRKAKETAQVMFGAQTPQDVTDRLNYVGTVFGDDAKKQAAKEIAKNIPGGDINKATPDQIAKAMTPVINRFATMGEQFTKASEQVSHQDRMASLEEKTNNDRQERLDSAARINIERQGLDLNRSKFEFAKEKFGDATKVEDKGQTELTKDQALQNFSKMDKSYQTAKNVVDTMATTGFSSVSGAMAKSLMTEYGQMTANYRAFQSAGKFTIQQQKDFDSRVSKITGYLQSFGEGKTFSPQALKEVSEEINRMYNDGNAEALKATLAVKDKVYERGGDPNVIRSPAKLKAAVDAGKAQLKTDKEGNQVVIFGNSPEDRYYLRDRPKARRNEIYDTTE